MRHIISTLVILTAGCTTVNHNNYTVKVNEEPYHYVDSQFRESLEIFTLLASTKGIKVNATNLSITFGLTRSKKSRVVATCAKNDLDVMIIKVHDESWSKMDISQREETIFHELGHCLLDRPHCSAKKKGKPISLMYAYMTPKDHYKNHRKEMIDELFNIDPRCQ